MCDRGFCIQTDSLSTTSGRWYLNMVRHSLCEMPIAHSGKVVTREFILSHGIGSMKIPFDMGSFRKLKERADGARHTSYCVDVVFNPFIIQMFTDDAFNEIMKEYRPFIINLVLKRVESSIGVKLSSQKVKLVKKFLYKDGTGPNSDQPREFTELPQEIDDCEEEVQPSSKKAAAAAAAAAAPEEPLIQDITPGQRKKQALKKGFFNNAKTELYPEGSKEGVVPENAGDPLGYLPKKLRQTCKVVDTNSPEYQENEKKKQAADSHNAMNSEFRDMLSSDLGKWNKPGNQWDQDDLPDGAEEPQPNAKYENDYSRFDRIKEEEDKPEVEKRDHWFDENGKMRPHAAPKPAAPTAAEASSGPAMKKGFLDSAKSPLYPKGSEQRAPTDEADFMKSLGGDESEMRAMLSKLGMSDDTLGELDKGLDGLLEPKGAPQAHKPSNIAAKFPERKAPEYKIVVDDNEGLLQLVVDVPKLESMQGVDLDVTDRCASIAFPSSVGLSPLKVQLPSSVIPASVKAKFSKKTHQITVKLPLLLQVAKAG